MSHISTAIVSIAGPWSISEDSAGHLWIEVRKEGSP